MYSTARGDNIFIGTLGPATTVVSAVPATVKRLIWGGTYVGTIAIYNSATSAGTAASNEVITVGIPLTRYPDSIELNFRCNNGITVVETGTPTNRVIWGE